MEVDISGSSKSEEFVCDSNDALELKLVRSTDDLEDEATSFKPDMSHQIFGDSESIFGYKGLKVKLYYSACSLAMYMGLEYTSVVDPKSCEYVEADNVLQTLQEKLQLSSVFTNIDNFLHTLQDDESFIPPGNKLTSFSIEQDIGHTSYEIYHCDTSSQKFLDFHSRLQTFIMFFIDAASYIDIDDSKWQFFTVYEKFKNSCGFTCYAVAGYCTVYQYYAYPDRTRPRISQMLILPPFQRQGLGARLLCTVYQHYRGQESVLDITVEDPNEEFQHLRDYVDTCLCASLPAFAPPHLRQGFTSDMAKQACNKYKINKKQARRVYEILRLRETNIHDEADYTSFRLDVKRRLNIPYQKESVLMKKLKFQIEKNPQLLTSLGLKKPEQRFETLEQLFIEVEKEYKMILARVEEYPLPTN